MLVGSALAIDPAHKANGNSILLGNILALPLLDEKRMGYLDNFVHCKLTEVPLTVLVTCKAFLELDLLLFLA